MHVSFVDGYVSATLTNSIYLFDIFVKRVSSLS